jgi:hypothetical protein
MYIFLSFLHSYTSVHSYNLSHTIIFANQSTIVLKMLIEDDTGGRTMPDRSKHPVLCREHGFFYSVACITKSEKQEKLQFLFYCTVIIDTRKLLDTVQNFITRPAFVSRY